MSEKKGLIVRIKECVEMQRQIVAASEPSGTVKNVFGFVGAKDGLGTSTIVASVASILAVNNYTVGILDFDLHFPEQQRFFIKPGKVKNIVSISTKFLDSSVDTQSLLNDTVNNRIKLITARTPDSVPSYFDLSERSIISIIEDMRELFDFVVIDFGGVDMGYESLTIGTKHCDIIFAVTTPMTEMIEATIKELKFLESHRYHAEKSVKIIQNMVFDNPYPESKLKTDGMETLAVLPFMREVALYRYTNKLLINTTVEGKLADVYRRSMRTVAEYLLQYSDMSSYTLEEDTSEATEDSSNEAQIAEHQAEPSGIEVEQEEELDLSNIDWDVFTRE